MKQNILKSVVVKSFVASLFVATAFIGPIQAADKDVAVVDIVKVIQSSRAFADMTQQLEERQKAFHDKIQREEALIQKHAKEIEAQKNALSKEALTSKKAAFEKEREKLQRISYEERSILEKAYEDAFAIISNKTSEIIKEKSKSDGYNVVLDKRMVYYIDEALDITNSVSNSLNKAISNVQVDFEEAKKSLKAVGNEIIKENTNKSSATK